MSKLVSALALIGPSLAVLTVGAVVYGAVTAPTPPAPPVANPPAAATAPYDSTAPTIGDTESPVDDAHTTSTELDTTTPVATADAVPAQPYTPAAPATADTAAVDLPAAAGFDPPPVYDGDIDYRADRPRASDMFAPGDYDGLLACTVDALGDADPTDPGYVRDQLIRRCLSYFNN